MYATHILCRTLLVAIAAIFSACASIAPELAPRVAQPKIPAARNFTSFSSSLRCLDEMLVQARKPTVLVSSTGIPDYTKKISVGGDDMLINAINQMNIKSRAYIFVDQNLEKLSGQIALKTVDKDRGKQPRLYIRGSISQLDSGVVNDTITLDLNLDDAPNPVTINGGALGSTNNSRSKQLSVVSVDMHLVTFPSKTVIPGSSVSNSMVVSGHSWGAGASGLIKMTGFDLTLQLNRIESQGQAVRSLIELGTIELLGRHARVPYWECLNIRTTNERVTTKEEQTFLALPHNFKATQAQLLLRRLGYYDGPKTGVMDRQTRRAISKFQADQKLIATGDLDFDTWERLQERALGFPTLTEPRLVGDPLDPPTTDLPESVKKALPINGRLSRSQKTLRMTPTQKTFRVADSFTVDIKVNHDGFLICYHQTNNGGIRQILPTQPGARMRVTQGTLVRIPSSSARFNIVFENTRDDEAILCILDQREKPVFIGVATADSVLGEVRAKSFLDIVKAHRNRSLRLIWKEVRMRAK